MAQRTSAIPETAGQVRDRLLRFKQAGPSVEDAKAAMLAAKETATTVGRGTKVPEFIAKAAPQESRGQGGNTPVVQPAPVAAVVQHAPQNEIPESRNETVKDNRTLQALRFNAQQKLQRQGYRAGTSVVLADEVKKGVITREEAEALLGSPIQDDEAPEQAEEVIEPVAEVPPAPETPARVAVEPEPEAAKTIDHKHFTGKISRDGKLWVAEIVYKNGAGTERFSANSKDELMLKLLEGKGNGTLRVRKAVQNEKLGADHQDWSYIVQQIREAYNITEEEYLASPQSVRAAMVDNVQFVETKGFLENNPEYEEKYGTDRNKERITKWLENKKPQSWPMTSHNLQLAYEDLLADDLLEVDPDYLLKKQVSAVPTAVEVPAQPVATRTEDSAVAVVPVPVAQAPAQAPAAPAVRKRGTTGLIPGSSSAVSETATRAEDGNKQPEPSVSELRNMPIADLKRIATKDRKYARY